ncbi:phosphoenolpyruvate--protein phosphotransferase [Endomicrobiia bacterium]|nr:phosphoenolpyruvate--protein phosphotransferase [Endomicrobiia bacterium]GHT11032.1 phosphoenolpyruvate--protein phosphotransferase [Endomicrobiia bacterium]GHT19477.1 phosphoenolpyruvate--protein phosphotransferase [Endomicrobiia bacterium]GHT25815.1 phosphoenolpyruvate--protein phosphotransferase [Endomicrobiia bacterium]GHT31934.1 phosphoenolpyruvate--protein phosphotransferase [Endomicrobiia bacterium]
MPDKDIIIKGVAASPGIAIGKAFLFENDDFCLVHKEIPQNERKDEKKRLNDAIEKTKAELKITHDKINGILGKNYAQITNVYLLILDDPSIRKDVDKFIDEGVNAEYSVFMVIDKIVRSFETIKDDYFKERILDIQDIGKKVLRNLLGKQRTTLASSNEDSIVVSHNLAPADTVAIKEKLVKGFATDIGGKTSHTAIVAQGLAIPAVAGLKVISSQAKTGDTMIVDGNKGEIILNPSAEILTKYKKECDMQFAKRKELEKLKDLPAETIDSHKVLIFANIDNPDEVQSVLDSGAMGIGLYRTEFMYFNRKTMPSEKDHFEEYFKVAEAISPYPTIIRTIDLGGDKLTRMGLLSMKHEENPFLGLRAIRLCLKYPDIFVDQLRAVLKASAYGKIKLMYPMISTLEELHEANRILEKVKQDLKKEHIKFDEKIEVGSMIEVPSAAMIIEAIAKEVDFVSIGTNDLIQYTLAVDRVNENVASLYDPLHPTILRFIKRIIDESHKAGIDVGMCGEMAGDPYYTPVLLGLGLDEFSVASAQIPKIKRVIRNISFGNVQRIAEEILNCGDRDSISKIISTIQMQ